MIPEFDYEVSQSTMPFSLCFRLIKQEHDVLEPATCLVCPFSWLGLLVLALFQSALPEGTFVQ